ncbi:hypothetical protein Trisim1_000841 [Trichoderma cf. simile WF8]
MFLIHLHDLCEHLSYNGRCSRLLARSDMDWPKRKMPSRHTLAIPSMPWLYVSLIGTCGYECNQRQDKAI